MWTLATEGGLKPQVCSSPFVTMILKDTWIDMLNSVESLTNCSCFLHKQMLS